ncbi:MAG TPA: folylpolyglutamate synthase/dihydrofolate synthase family protein [Chitinophagaceae bacterium]
MDEPRHALYDETIEYLFARLPMFSRIGAAAYRKDLHNTIALCTFLDHPEKKFRSVHVAGTNGKGSVSHMLASVLQCAGYKTGLYTSPHLKDFRERIKINGTMIEKQFVVDFTNRIAPMITQLDPSFFEITVAMAFQYFTETAVDVAVIETGLGGRLDSTNVIIPELSVITNIGWDHMNLLGDSLVKIAYEKAGIIKDSVPVVVGETSPETLEVFESVAAQRRSQLTIASATRQAVSWQWQQHELVVEVAHQHHTDHLHFHLDLPGIYQAKNLLTVLEACSQLRERGWELPDEAIRTGLQHTKKITGLHGRWEVIRQHPMIVVDVAHNEDGVKMLAEQIEVTNFEKLHIILGVVNDKDIRRLLGRLPTLATYYFTQAQIPRALSPVDLQKSAAEFHLHGNTFGDVNEALISAIQQAGKNDLIVVCGSIFLVGEVAI